MRQFFLAATGCWGRHAMFEHCAALERWKPAKMRIKKGKKNRDEGGLHDALCFHGEENGHSEKNKVR